MSVHIKLDPEFVADFCKRNQIRKLALFGSVLTDRFRPESDVDILVEFEEGARVGYIAMAGRGKELAQRVGPKRDPLNTEELRRSVREQVVATDRVPDYT